MRHQKFTRNDARGLAVSSTARAPWMPSAFISLARAARRIPPDWLPIAAIALSLAYYCTVPSPLLSLPGLLAFAILAWLRLDLVLCLLPLTFPFWYVPKRVGGNVVFPLSEVALAVCCAAALARGVWSVTRNLAPRTEEKATQQAGIRAWRPAPASQDGTANGDAGVIGEGPRPLRAALTILARLRCAGTPVLIGAALLLLGTALGVLIARRPHEALRAFRWEVAEPLLYGALLLLSLRRRHMRVLVGAFLATALLLAALAAVQVFWLHVTFAPLTQGNRLIPYTSATGGIPRATALIFGSGNTLGAWMARALPLALALALLPRAIPWRWRMLPLAVALACVPALLWSDSRGALLAALAACAAVVLLALPGRRWALGIALVGALGAAIVLLANRAAVLSALIYGHGGSGELRTLVWLAAWHMIRDHPLLGIGPDQFLYYYSSLYTHHPYWILYQNGHRTIAWTEPNLAQPHNLVLDLWLSGGLLALAGFVLVLAALWTRCWRLWRAAHQPAPGGLRPASNRAPVQAPSAAGRRKTDLQSRDSTLRAAVALGIGASVLAGVLHGMVDSAYFQPDLALLLWWAVGVVTLLARA